MQKAIEYFQQAIAADPGYALAYAGLAVAYGVLPTYNSQLSPREVVPKAKEAARKALSLDDNLAEAHAALAKVLDFFDYDFGGAEREHKRALELNPKYAAAHAYYGEYLVCQGHNFSYGFYLFRARRYDEAITQLKKTIELDANSPTPHRGLADAYWGKGLYWESVEETESKLL